MTTNTMTINKTYTINAMTNDDGTLKTAPVKVSDTATVDAPVYAVEFKTADYRQPDSRYLLDADTFTANVNRSATAIVVNEILNTIGKLNGQIDRQTSSDECDVKTLADTIARRDALKSFIDKRNAYKTTANDDIATAFAYAIVSPKYTEYGDASALIQLIRDAYDGKNGVKVSDVKTAVATFANARIAVNDSTKGVVYKNIRARLNDDATRELINVIGVCPLSYGKRGIVDKHATVNRATVQLLLFVLRDTFELTATATNKTATASVMVL